MKPVKSDNRSLFMALLLVLSVISLLLLMLPSSKLDHLLMAVSIVVSTAALFLAGLKQRTVYVRLSPDGASSDLAQTADAVRTEESLPEQSGEEPGVMEEVVEVPSEAMPEREQPQQPEVQATPSQTEKLRAFRVHQIEPFIQDVEQADTFNLSEEARKEFRRRLLRIAFLSMDVTDLLTRPTTPGEEEILALMNGDRSFDDVIQSARPVNDNPNQTPKRHRNMKTILDSDGGSYYWSSYRF